MPPPVKNHVFGPLYSVLMKCLSNHPSGLLNMPHSKHFLWPLSRWIEETFHPGRQGRLIQHEGRRQRKRFSAHHPNNILIFVMCFWRKKKKKKTTTPKHESRFVLCPSNNESGFTLELNVKHLKYLGIFSVKHKKGLFSHCDVNVFLFVYLFFVFSAYQA